MHSSSKEQEDKNRRLKKIDSAEKALEELIPKLNVYHSYQYPQISDLKPVNGYLKYTPFIQPTIPRFGGGALFKAVLKFFLNRHFWCQNHFKPK